MPRSSLNVVPSYFKIPSPIIDEAVKCKKQQACLSDPYHVLCKVSAKPGETPRIIACQDDAPCAYNSNLGNQQVCSCPVRHAIYRKYGV